MYRPNGPSGLRGTNGVSLGMMKKERPDRRPTERLGQKGSRGTRGAEKRAAPGRAPAGTATATMDDNGDKGGSVQKASYERALSAVERLRRAQLHPFEDHEAELSDQERRFLRELGGGRSPVLLFEVEDGPRVVVKIVQVDSGGVDACPIGFPPGAVNVIPVLDVFAWADGYGLMMPLADRSLRQWLRERDPMSGSDDLLTALGDVAEALASIEGRMVHGDIKPENILYYEGRWCLADFGPSACRVFDEQRHEYLLTPPYAAPEQWRRETLTSRTDVYAFGVLAFELLTGSRPFPGPALTDYRYQHLVQQPPSPRSIVSPLAGTISACLAKEPSSRPTSGEVASVLASVSAMPASAVSAVVAQPALAADASGTAVEQEIPTLRLVG